MTRKRTDSIAYQQEVASKLADPLPTPPMPLSDRAMVFWPIVIESKRRDAWTGADLTFACVLCRDLAAIAELLTVMADHRPIYKDDKGVIRAHPAEKALADLIARAQSVARHIQVHARATNGPAREQQNKNQLERDLASSILGADDDLADLFARPGALLQ